MEENNNFLYKGYLLVVEPHDIRHWWSECKELEYYAMNSSIPFLKELFKQFVDEKLEKEETKMKFVKTFKYHGWDLDIYDERGICIGINSDLHYLDKCVLETNLIEKFIEFVKGGRINKEVDLLITYEIVYRDYILKIKESSATEFNYSGECDSGFWGNNNNLAELISDFRKFVDRNIEELAWEMKEKETDKDKKIAELVKVIDGLNKKLEEKDKKIERLKNKIATVKLEINKAE